VTDKLDELLVNNQRWSEGRRREDPEFFSRLTSIQRPDYLWIGCADSRVPANTIVGLRSGELFVHRNVANIVHRYDPNCLSVLQYAVDVLEVKHVIVCGHYRCGGVQAALGPSVDQPLESWISPLRVLASNHADELAKLPSPDDRWHRLCQLNVTSQVESLVGTPTVQSAWARGQALTIHGWIYDLSDGLLEDLGVTVDGTSRDGI
jgi:carbonic anhydrase